MLRTFFSRQGAPAPPRPAAPEAPVEHRGWLGRIGALAAHRHGRLALGAIAFADSSFLPVPPDLLLVPMVLFRPEQVRLLLIICTVASSLGAALGYLIGYGLWSTIGGPLVDFYGYADQFTAYQQLVAAWGFWIIIAKAFTPIPFKIAAIAAGVAAMDPVTFMVATVLGRAVHFAMVGGLLVLCGARILALIARYERMLALASILVLLAAAVFYWLG
jgi:membrane protein YqaA with SNARE-associated domain